ncbi:MAG: flagellar export chaperone FlgN [Angelakisella sp.]|nr:flagellar export chaperone FlgN [Angelakisella sp.]
MNNFQDFISFMQDYTAFYEGLVDSQKDKLKAMLSHNLKKIDQSVCAQQADAMKIESMESKRASLQQDAGFDGKTLQEIISLVPGAEAEMLRELAKRINQAVAEIRYYNDKSIDVVKTNIQAVNGAAEKLQGYTAKKQTDSYNPTSIFETKI